MRLWSTCFSLIGIEMLATFSFRYLDKAAKSMGCLTSPAIMRANVKEMMFPQLSYGCQIYRVDARSMMRGCISAEAHLLVTPFARIFQNMQAYLLLHSLLPCLEMLASAAFTDAEVLSVLYDDIVKEFSHFCKFASHGCLFEC